MKEFMCGDKVRVNGEGMKYRIPEMARWLGVVREDHENGCVSVKWSGQAKEWTERSEFLEKAGRNNSKALRIAL